MRVVAASLRREASQTLRAPRELAKEPGLEGNRFPDGVLAHARVQGFAPNDRRITTSKGMRAPPRAGKRSRARESHPTTRATCHRGWLPVRPGAGRIAPDSWLASRLGGGRLQNR